MKNNNLFILMAAVFALISCGTANRTAYYGGTQFRNSIYHTPNSTTSQEYLQEQEYLQNLQERTTSTVAQQGGYSSYIPSTDTRTVYVGENNEVNIDARPGVTYKIVDDQESYEARLRKFDSPFYSINIDIYDPYPWYGYRYGHYSPYWGSWYGNWGYRWYNHYGWHTPGWNWMWNWHYNWRWDPWYANSYWGWYDPFYDPWWGPSYWPGYYWPVHRPGIHPGHKPGHHPGAGPGAKPNHGREIYYGKRNSSPSYNNANRNNGTNGNVAGRPNTGSVTRKPANVTQINNGTRNPGHNASQVQNNGRPQNNAAVQAGNNQYRRVAPGGTKSGSANTGHVGTGKNNGKQSSTTVTYSKGKENGNNKNSQNSSYNRQQNSSSQNRSSFSNSSNGGSRSSGYSNSGNSGGSSYRRR